MLYKYVSINSLSFKSIIEKQEVYFASPNKLNDPFEFNPQFLFPSKSKLKKHLIQRGAKKNNLEILIPKAIKDLKRNESALIKCMNVISKMSGVLCMTPHNDNLLMWAHYGDSHHGICIGFDITLPFDDIFGYGYEVEYKNEYPKICLTEMDMLMASLQNGDDMEQFDSITTRQIFTKANIWSYENEIRFHRHNYQFNSASMSFPSNKLKEIILGANISKDNEDMILKLIIKSYPNAKIMKSKLSKQEYKLEIT